MEDTGAGRRQTGQGRRIKASEGSRLPSSVSRLPASGVAVLALQGDFEAHRKMLDRIGLSSFEAKKPEQLAKAAGLIIPGGESTTLWKFFESAPWEEAITRFAASGRPVLGTCAGAIVLARQVFNPAQKGLGLLDIAVERNAYGRQADSFVGVVEAPTLGGELPAVFIRAPRIRGAGPAVEILATREGDPVLARQDNVVAATFHPELTDDERVHRMVFAGSARERRSA